MSFIVTGLREMRLKVRRERTRWSLRHARRVLQRSEIALGREGTSQAANFPELRQEIVSLRKLEQEQKEFASKIAQIEEGLSRLEHQRQTNAAEQKEALARLEEERAPLLAERNAARETAALCDRELAGVERRVQDNDRVDRDLQKKIADLQAQVPPPADLEGQTTTLSAQRARLPAERAELARAREGSADACRHARQKLGQAQGRLDEVERKMAKVREDFEARDRVLNNTAREQQDAIKEARARHATVEERKNPAYLNIGRHLANQGVAPPNATGLLEDVRRHRENVSLHVEHKDELALLSEQIDKQELRKFYFSIVSVLVLLAIVLPLVLKSPAPREWLPRDTEAILSLNVEQLERSELLKRWRKDEGETWQTVSAALLGQAAQAPALNVPRDSLRVTRAVTSSKSGEPREFVLVESRSDVRAALQRIRADEALQRRTISGLPVWQRPDFAYARVGPRTFAVGPAADVEELVRVRLGLRPDLQITGQLFAEFQALDQGSTVRLISRDPANLPNIFQPIFSRELLESTTVMGLSLTLDKGAKARLIVRARTPEAAAELARRLRDEPQRWLQFQESGLMLFVQPPEVTRRDTTVDARFEMPENAARLLLERLSRGSQRKMVVR